MPLTSPYKQISSHAGATSDQSGPPPHGSVVRQDYPGSYHGHPNAPESNAGPPGVKKRKGDKGRVPSEKLAPVAETMFTRGAISARAMKHKLGVRGIKKILKFEKKRARASDDVGERAKDANRSEGWRY